MNSRTRRKLVWVSLAALIGLNAQAATETNPPAPAIRFATNVYDFGKVTGDVFVNCVFTFTNVGSAALEIENVAPSCGCLKVADWTRQVGPSQTGTIRVIFDTRYHIGGFGKSVAVACNDPAHRNVELEIQGTVWRAIEITPPAAALVLCAEVNSNATIVRLISHEDEPVTLSDLRVVDAAVKVELQTNQPGKEWQLVVRSPVPVPASSQQGFITLKSSSTNLPVVTVKTYLNVLPVLMAIPTQIKLPPLPLASAYSGKFWVRNNGTNALELSEPVVNAAGVSVDIKTNTAANPPTEVTVTFPAGFDAPAGTNLELRLKNSAPLFPLLTVPIQQTGRR